MKNRKKNFMVFGLGIALLVSSMAVLTKWKEKDKAVQMECFMVEDLGRYSNEDGFYYINQDLILQFYDYQSGQNVIVCNKPNCEHRAWDENVLDERRCNAYINGAQSFFTYGEKLYVIELDSKKNNLSVIQSELDRSNQRLFASLDSEYIGNVAIKDGKMYFATLQQEFKKDESGMPVQTGRSSVSFCSLDLNSGEIEDLYKMEKHFNAQLSIVGCYQECIYSIYGYFEEKFTGLNYDEAKRRLRWFSYDTESGEMQTALAALSDIDINRCEIANGKLFYGKWRDREDEISDIFCYDLLYKTNEKVISDSYNFGIFDNRIFANDSTGEQCTVYDINTGESCILKREGEEIQILAEYGNEFIVARYQDGNVTYGYIQKDKYYSGDVDLEALN